jgi:hypothetical protein
MDREVRPAQHHPSPHRGVKGSRRDSTDQVNPPPSPALPPPPPGLKAGRVGGPDHSSCIRLPTAPPRVLRQPGQRSLEGGTQPTKRPPQHHLLMPSTSTSGMSHWAFKLTFQSKAMPATRTSPFFAAFPFRRSRAANPLNPLAVAVASIGGIVREIVANQPPAPPALKPSL